MSRFVFGEMCDAEELRLSVMRVELAALRFQRAAWLLGLALKQNFNQGQPRVPAGSPDGGQWAGSDGFARLAQNRARNVNGVSAGGKADPTFGMSARDRKAARRTLVVAGKGGNFAVEPNPAATGNKPIQEIASFSDVKRYDPLITQVAKDQSVNPDLIRAVMYAETTHGRYDAPFELLGINGSIRPMNVNVDFWGAALGVTRNDLENPLKNIQAGTRILRGILDNTDGNAPISVVATLYNDLGAKKVTDYGARVEAIFRERLWERK
jgi:soluble lytic murein transglycosylase-like protein